jgi:peptide/nickel transport system ATP-binding protein
VSDALVEIDDLKVHFPIKSGLLFDRTVGHVYAVDGVSLKVKRGETYGLVGESGCGKSTLGRGLLRLVEPTSGGITFDGTDVRSLKGEQMRLFRRRIQMVFQDPLSSLDPRQSVESLLVEGLKAHGLHKDKADVQKRLKSTLDSVGLPASALNKYPHEFSGGQRQRIGIARALVLGPELIVADEPVSALDVSIQAQVVNLLGDLQDSLGLTYLVIAHDLAVVRHISDTIGVMYLGSLVEEADGDQLYDRPLHPYTRALMSAVPVPDPQVEDRRERIQPTRRTAAGSTPAARGRSRPAAPANARSCGCSTTPASGWPATTPRRSSAASSRCTRYGLRSSARIRPPRPPRPPRPGS